MAKELVVIIPARSGSKGLSDKNIKLLAGHPLLSYSIAAAKLSNINPILVSTDSDEYADIAKYYGASVPFIRPKEISADKSTDFEFMKHAMEWYKKNHSKLPNYWLHLRPTTPLRDPLVINKAIELITKNPLATSLRSGHEVPESPFKWFMKDRDGFFKGLEKNLTPELVNKPRQKFPKMYNPDGYIDVVKSSHVLNNNTLHGDKMLVFVTPRCTEVDTKEDFDYLEYEIKKQRSPLLNWLDKKVS